MARRSPGAALAAWLWLGGGVGGEAAVVSAEVVVETDSPEPGRLLDVPFLAQTEDLCGGAAAAMVLRYWGERAVHPEDFATLVDRSQAGIRTDVLSGEFTRRGWRALAVEGDGREGLTWIREHVDAGRPIVALIEVRPSRLHYVVVVGVTDERVVMHDPARAPFQVVSRMAFDAAWARANRWAVLVLPQHVAEPDGLPPRSTSRPVAESRGATNEVGGCAPLVDAMVAQALSGDLETAGQGLEVATTLCQASAMAWRELGGVRFRQSRWAEAAQSAARAARLEPDDPYGWGLLATSQYLDGRPLDALRSWNRLDRPRVDVVHVSGPHRTPDPVIVGALHLAPRTPLTPERLAHAARRLAELPSLAVTRLRYQPLDDGRADVEAVVIEAPAAPRGVVRFAAIAAHAAIHREVRLDVASPTGSGERWSAGWRWWHDRPRVTFSVATPSPAWLPGVSTVEGLWERATYAVAPTGGGIPLVRLERRRAGFAITDWATSRLRWRGAAALDRWADDSHASAGGELDLRVADDHVALGAEAAAWVPLGTGSPFVTVALSVAGRSSTSGGMPRWWGQGGVSQASAAAPLDLWSGAGLGRARTPLLRAHPLLHGGVVAGPIFGRRLLHATVEHQRAVIHLADSALGLAVFVDVARAWHRPRSGAAWHADAGLGLRLALPADTGRLRLDLARGLRDGGYVLSAGWHTATSR